MTHSLTPQQREEVLEAPRPGTWILPHGFDSSDAVRRALRLARALAEETR